MTNENYFKKGLKEIDLNITDSEISRFLIYLDLLKKWGNKINLTTILEDKEIILKHFIDSLTISKLVDKNSKVLDIGSGAGFPGIPLLLFENTLQVTLIETVQKKTVFLREVKRSLKLDNLNIICSRAEVIENELINFFDYIVFRAVGKIDYLLALSKPYLKKDGEVIIMKSDNVAREIEESDSAIFYLKSFNELQLPFSGDNRSILVYKFN